VQFEDIHVGEGEAAATGSTVTLRYTLALNRVEIVQDDNQVSFRIGARRVIAGLERGIEGMRVGGRRKIKVSPHLAYGHAGIPPVVPVNAVLLFDVTLLEVST
jgi:FKBP-type peptidyl-prolyl cis-trans isomerase